MEREEGRRQWLLLRLLKPYIIQPVTSERLWRGASVSDQGDKTEKNSNPSIQLSNTKSQTQQPERKWPGAEPSYEASTCPLLGNAREALTHHSVTQISTLRL